MCVCSLNSARDESPDISHSEKFVKQSHSDEDICSHVSLDTTLDTSTPVPEIERCSSQATAITEMYSLRKADSDSTFSAGEGQITLTEDNVYSELSSDFRQMHFLSGLLLSELSNVLDCQ